MQIPKRELKFIKTDPVQLGEAYADNVYACVGSGLPTIGGVGTQLTSFQSRSLLPRYASGGKSLRLPNFPERTHTHTKRFRIKIYVGDVVVGA